ncbi:MAG: hypothetical protein ACXWVD_00320 [Telluria sp.]
MSDESAVAIDDFHKHELLDRVHCVSTMFDALVREHPAADADPAVRAAVDEVSERIGTLYQQVGEAYLK